MNEEHKNIEHNDEWLTKEIDKAYEKLDSGKAKFHSHENAMSILELRKRQIKERTNEK